MGESRLHDATTAGFAVDSGSAQNVPLYVSVGLYCLQYCRVLCISIFVPLAGGMWLAHTGGCRGLPDGFREGLGWHLSASLGQAFARSSRATGSLLPPPRAASAAPAAATKPPSVSTDPITDGAMKGRGQDGHGEAVERADLHWLVLR
eukprot:scaffold6123_cov113-Isochrysis_galbana.AAC.1